MIEIEYGCVYKSSIKPFDKGNRIESTKDAGNEYKRLLAVSYTHLTLPTTPYV